MADREAVWIEGGTFLMGSDEFYPEERPVHRVAVDGFWMDAEGRWLCCGSAAAPISGRR